ncbi:MAG: hypothetical protein V1911_00685, partial [Candidatus Micrarchaeota archaeon]
FLNKEYTEKWYEMRGNQLLNVLKVRHFFELLSDKDLKTLEDMFPDPQELLEFSDGSKFGLFLKVFAKSPSIALKAARTLR